MLSYGNIYMVETLLCRHEKDLNAGNQESAAITQRDLQTEP